MSISPSRTQAANQARQQAIAGKLQRIRDTLRHMRRDHVPVTYPAVARRAEVSRTFLYQNAKANALVTEAITSNASRRQQAQAKQDTQAEVSWRERALNAEDALKTSHAEIRTQRNRIAVLMGQARDLQAQYGEDTAQRLATENTTLKQRVRQLIQDQRSLEEKLQAARSNNRFADRRIADLEAQLLELLTNQP
jgi:chromosome segregation ATPase